MRPPPQRRDHRCFLPDFMDANQELAAIIDRFVASDDALPTPIPGLMLSRRSSSNHCVHTAQWPCFALVVQGAKSLTLGSEVYRYGVGDYLLVSLDLPVTSQTTEATPAVPNLGIGMRIDPEHLNAVLGRINTPHPPGRSDMRAVAVNTAPPELLDAVVRLLRLLDRPEDIAAMAPLIEQEILYRILTGPSGPALIQLARLDTPANKVGQAVAWLRQNFARPLRIDTLAEQVGMSASSLHHHFKAATAMTPMQYQKQLRLQEARRLMVVERQDVGSAGYSVGYQSPSQFSREYSRLYGQSPLRDVGGLLTTAE